MDRSGLSSCRLGTELCDSFTSTIVFQIFTNSINVCQIIQQIIAKELVPMLQLQPAQMLLTSFQQLLIADVATHLCIAMYNYTQTPCLSVRKNSRQMLQNLQYGRNIGIPTIRLFINFHIILSSGQGGNNSFPLASHEKLGSKRAETLQKYQETNDQIGDKFSRDLVGWFMRNLQFLASFLQKVLTIKYYQIMHGKVQEAFPISETL
eukprot:TRINITY_DN8604_c1_g1_i4.p1 TRINITY_DN8604_c1_g1~~TRINITY_DN8604_c1_g1_i4.p1  ORF type:complete len:207 (+),score=5.31 TRINITY_DN8604_c1_g1_i4:273-893(+)